ncbi:MAG: DUF3160 domain-containing protein [Candidatus Buchananbacteria bacterium]
MFDQKSPSSNQPVAAPVVPATNSMPASPFAPSTPTAPAKVPTPPSAPIKKTGKLSSAGWLMVIIFVFLILGSGSFAAYYWYVNYQLNSASVAKVEDNAQAPVVPAKSIIEKISDLIGAPIAMATPFANYQEDKVNITPAVATYQTEKDLSNIINKDQVQYISEAAKAMLAKNNFVVVPGYGQEFFSIYESNRYGFMPSFVSSDSLVHNYHLAFDFLLRSIETNKLKAELTTLTYNLVKASQAQYDQLKGTVWENAAKRNVAFFTVANRLVYSNAKPADYVATEVEAELKLINEHSNIFASPVMNIGGSNEKDPLKEDYSQYIARGHYTKTEDLKAYFKSMMFLGRMTFRLKSDDETKSAILLTQALESNQATKDSWEKIYEPTSFFVGIADDLTYQDYAKEIAKVYGQNYTLSDLPNEDKLQSFVTAAANLAGPKINSMPIFDARFQPDRSAEIKGLRFMGQRYTLDADIFQRLVYREVGDKNHACDTDPTTWVSLESRRLPSGLDLAAAFGSASAADLQTAKGETDYACYTQNLNKMRTYVASLNGQTWTQNLYWGWLYFLRPLLAEAPAGYPSFMLNDAWTKKSLNTFLGNWTELKHDTILYAKQVYAELGGGAPEKKDDRGWVEPNPYLYSRLAALAKMTKEGLQLRTLIDQNQIDLLDRLATLSTRLKEISEKELNNQALTDDDYELIRSYGGSLEHMWLEAVKDYGINDKSQLSQEPAAIVADVATDPNGQVLEEATGYISDIYVVVPIEGKLRVARGGVYSYYEFPWDINDRLTDEKWRSTLSENKQPAMPDWTSAFMAK